MVFSRLSINVTDIDCPLNTTECLLQAVLTILEELRSENSEYNWDPATFYVTVVIGLIAVFFAALTILQALLVAGPGRLKTSSYAIGPWAKFTWREFDHQEWRFHSFTQTPLIEFSPANILEVYGAAPADSDLGLVGSVKQMLQAARSERLAVTALRYSVFDRTPFPAPQYFPTGWMSLLSLMSMDHPGLWDRRSTGTDHLPAELAGVPAHSAIGTMVTVMLILTAGRCKISIDSSTGHVVARGYNFQLRTFDHSILGPVASFEIFRIDNTVISYHGNPATNPLIPLFAHAHGYVLLDGFWNVGPEERKFEVDSSPWIRLCAPREHIQRRSTRMIAPEGHEAAYANGPQTRRMMRKLLSIQSAAKRPWRAPSCLDAVTAPPSFHPSWCPAAAIHSATDSDADDLPSTVAARSTSKLNVSRLGTHGPLCLLTLRISIFNPPVFPANLADIRLRAQILALHSRFWPRELASEHLSGPINLWGFPSSRMLPEGTCPVFEVVGEMLFEIDEHAADMMTKDRVRAFNACIEYMKGNDLWTPSDGEDSDKISDALLRELDIVDSWLKKNAPSDAICRTCSLSVSATAIHNILDSRQYRPGIWMGEPRQPDIRLDSDNFYSRDFSRHLEVILEEFQVFNKEAGLYLSKVRPVAIEDDCPPFAAYCKLVQDSGDLKKRARQSRDRIKARMLAVNEAQANETSMDEMDDGDEYWRPGFDAIQGYEEKLQFLTREMDELETRTKGDEAAIASHRAKIRNDSLRPLATFLKRLETGNADSSSTHQALGGGVVGEFTRTTKTGDLVMLPQRTPAEVDSLLGILPRFLQLWELEEHTVQFEYRIPPEGLHPLDDIIIYRGILMAATLSCCFDNSQYLDDATYQRVIPFI